jgi:hypothetical protein
MTELDFIKCMVGELGNSYLALGKSQWIEPPQWCPIESEFRHSTQHDCLLIYLKGIRWVSLLNASIVLLEAGQVHEMGILCRCMDESLEDMLLFCRNLGADGKPTEAQERVLMEFFQEQFEDSSSPMLVASKRDRVRREKVRAAIAGLPENQVNPHDHAQINGTIYDTFSGYVHGAYPHIMELYGGNPPHFHTAGMKNTPRIGKWQTQLVGYLYRGVLGAWFVAKRLGEESTAQSIFALRNEMEQRYPPLAADPNDLLKEMKKRSRK